ncbi:MAG TPA: RcpC/CpaB family pilus assembly protein [Bacilli bacterium]|nr:RcpC/CpaB family pilus assembly protein [Bacilli bacterium]
MKNLTFKLKKFLQNKNTVTIIGVILIVAILYFGYNWRIEQATTPVKVPYANTTIQPRTQITEDMISYVEVLPSMVTSSTITDVAYIVGKWSNYNTMIPEGSLFYDDAVVTAAELPDSAFVDIPDGYTAFYLAVDTETTYGNSIYPGNYIDLYFKALDEDGKVIVGKLIQNIEVLAVKDRNGQHVFENSEEERTPSIIIFAVPDDMFLLLRKATYLENVKEISAELIPVPTTESYSVEPGTISLTSTYLETFIELNTGSISEDQLPDVYDPTEE